MLLDTSAWVEFFEGTKNAERVKEILLSQNCYTSMVSVAEVANWAEKEGQDLELLIDNMNKLSIIIPPDLSISRLAGKLNFKRKKTVKKWGMMDSFVLATALVFDLKIVTKDLDFDDLPNVLPLKH